MESNFCRALGQNLVICLLAVMLGFLAGFHEVIVGGGIVSMSLLRLTYEAIIGDDE